MDGWMGGWVDGWMDGWKNHINEGYHLKFTQFKM
jgi:hypothetical protein